MRTSSEIKRNNIRKANLIMESGFRKNKGSVANQFGLYEQCGTGRDVEGEYMGAPLGTEPMGDTSLDMMDDDMLMDFDIEVMDDDDMPMDDEMLMMMMNEEQKGGGDCDRDPDYVGNQTGCEGKCPDCGPCGVCNDDGKKLKADSKKKKQVDEKYYGGGGGCHCACEGTLSDPSNPSSGPECRHDCCSPLQIANIKKCGSLECSDRSDFDGRKSRVIGVDSNIEKQRELKESYKAVSATPSRDSWGNKFNNILTESNQVSGINSLIKRMNKVIK